MDDSIYRDYYAAADWLARKYDTALPYLTSDLAIRLYVLLGAMTFLVASVIYAYRLMAELRHVELDAFTVKPRGRKPMKPESVERARERLLAFRQSMWCNYGKLLAVFIICGFLIPSVGLFFAGVYYNWFDPAGIAFVSLNDNSPVTNPEIWATAKFVANQLSHGALMDFLEIFHIDLGEIANNPDNYFFSGSVFLYRTFVGTFAFAMLFFLRRAIVIAWRIPPVKELVPTPAD